MKPCSNHIFFQIRTIFLLSGGLLLITPGFGQKYNFVNYNVESGLLQSQALCITQDHNNELWIGTYGGVSRFDGSHFVNYDKSQGIANNIILDIETDRQGHIWMATSNGITEYDGLSFKNYFPAATSAQNAFQQLVVDKDNKIWALANQKIYRKDGQQFLKQITIDSVLAIAKDNEGLVYASTLKKQLLVYKHNQWIPVTDSTGNSDFFIVGITEGRRGKTLRCLSNKGVYELSNGILHKMHFNFPGKGKPGILRIFEDSKGTMWFSFEDGGAWQLSDGKWSHFTYKNGLTDDIVTTFFEDHEGNIWLGTNGSGLYRYASHFFTYYDRSSGLTNPSIITITQNRKNGRIYFSDGNGGLSTFMNNEPRQIQAPGDIGAISSIACDKDGILWAGSITGGLWSYNGKVFRRFSDPKYPNAFLNVYTLRYHKDVLWVSTFSGLYKINGDTTQRLNLDVKVFSSILPVGNDSLLLGSIHGALIYNLTTGTLTNILKDVNVICFTDDGNDIYIGTDDRGVVQWEKSKGRFREISVKDGLSCNYVYSLLTDANHNIWAGTGCGIDRISLKKGGLHIRSFGKSDGLIGVENNSNVSFKDEEGFLWFGTTRGLFRFNPAAGELQGSAPVVVLQSLKLFSKEIIPAASDSIIPFQNLPFNPEFHPGQNHLTFTFKGIYLSNPGKVKYRYQLVGAEKSFTETDQNTVVFSSLPPGDYVFKVWASDAAGTWYNNVVNYPFRIDAPFYQTWWFRILAGVLIIALFLTVVYIRNRMKTLRIVWEQKLREEEQTRVRQKTAEDFHDEIGNKLTRINLLTTIAENKVADSNPALVNLLAQIKQNVSSLYNGSRDIIWSLQPQSDYLDEIIHRIHQVATDMLQDTDIRLHYGLVQEEGLDLHRKMPIDYSRNLMMIFKELVNNTVRHAQAENIHLKITANSRQIIFILRDDGIGFNPAIEHSGNGLKNIRNRARRISGVVRIGSGSAKGTTTRLVIRFL